MVCHKQATIRAFERKVAQEIVVVAELLALGFGGLLHWVESGCSGQNWVAPSDQDVGFVAFGNVVVLVDTCFDLLEVEGGHRALSLGLLG